MKNILIFLTTVLIIVSCRQTTKTNEKEVADQLCNCFHENTGVSIDTRLSPCIDKIISSNQQLIKEKYNNVPGDSAIKIFSSKVMLSMVENCDEFYVEINDMYYNMYQADTSENIKKEIIRLSLAQADKVNSDSIVYDLHKLTRLQLQARDFQNAISTSKKILEIKPNEAGAYLALGYAYNGLREYDEAIKYLDKAILINNNKDYLILKAITLRRKKNAL